MRIKDNEKHPNLKSKSGCLNKIFNQNLKILKKALKPLKNIIQITKNNKNSGLDIAKAILKFNVHFNVFGILKRSDYFESLSPQKIINNMELNNITKEELIEIEKNEEIKALKEEMNSDMSIEN